VFGGDTLDEAWLMDMATRFHDLHEQDRGFAFRNQQPMVRGVRLVAIGLTDKPPMIGGLGTVTDAAAVKTGERRVHFGVDIVDTPTYDGASLGPGASIDGPALVEEPFTVVVVPPAATCRLGDHGAYELTLGRN